MERFKFSTNFTLSDDLKNTVYPFTALDKVTILRKKCRRTRQKRTDKPINYNPPTPFCFSGWISETNTIAASAQNQLDSTRVKSNVLDVHARSEAELKFKPNNEGCRNIEFISIGKTGRVVGTKNMESFKFSTNFTLSDDLKNTVYQFTALDKGTILRKKCRRIRQKRTDKPINYNPPTPFCFSRWISEINTIAASAQNQLDSTRVKSNVLDVHARPETELKFKSNNKGCRNIELKCELLENNFLITKTSIRSNVSAGENDRAGLINVCYQEVKLSAIQNLSLRMHLSSVVRLEKTKEHISNEFIQKVSKIIKVEKTMKISSSSVSKFETSSLACETSTARKSICANDTVYELIRQHRLSWWSDDDALLNFKSQSSPNRDHFRESNRMYLYKANSKSKTASCNYKHGRKCRVGKLEHWQSNMVPYNAISSESDSEERVVMKPKEEKNISWRIEFSDESELDDSGSSLDGSFRRHCSESSDSSCCESSEYFPIYCNRPVPPTSSRIFQDSPAEIETMLQETKRKQFWNSDLVENLDKHITEDFGFISVVLQTLQCICQYGENVNIEN